MSDPYQRSLLPQRVDVASLGRPVEVWQWFEQLRLRCDLTVELVSAAGRFVLDPLPERPGNAEVRRALERAGDAELSDQTAAALRSAAARSFTRGGARIRIYPVYLRAASPAVPVGALLIADRSASDEAAHDDTQGAVDARLDALAEWLVPAVEATLGADAGARDTVGAGVVEVVEAMNDLPGDRQIVQLLMDAAALWFDADVRLYRQHAPGDFVLTGSLPGADIAGAPARLRGHAFWSRQEVFAPASAREFDELGWEGSTADTLFVPLVVEDAVQWLLTVSGAEPAAGATLAFAARNASALLTNRQYARSEQLAANVSTILAFGDAPFADTARNGLECAAREIEASSAQLAVYSVSDHTPVLAIHYGEGEAEPLSFAEAGAATVRANTLTVSLSAGSGLTGSLRFDRQEGEFDASAAILGRAAASVFGAWLSGAFLAMSGARVAPAGVVTSDLREWLRANVDRLGHLPFGGALAVVEVPGGYPGVLDEMIDLVQARLRAADVVGVVDDDAVGVLLPDATRETAAAVALRLLTAARERRIEMARTGVALFAPSFEGPDSLLQRALMNARLGSSFS